MPTVWQKWLIRGGILALVGTLASAGMLCALWTSPEAVRQLVQDNLGDRFIRVGVEVGQARMRLLGGILVNDLRLHRSDSLDPQNFLFVPSAVLFHDKEHLLNGKVAIRRIELDHPELRIVRQKDGRFNLAGILGPVDLSERLPSLSIRHGSVKIEDQSVSPDTLLEIHDLELTLINDPLPILRLEGKGMSRELGPVEIRASVPRATMAASIQFHFPDIPVGETLVQRLANYCPEAREHLAGLTGKGQVQGKIQIPEQDDQLPRSDIQFSLSKGKLAHPRLPEPLQEIHLQARLVNQCISDATIDARLGKATLQGTLSDLTIPNRISSAEQDLPLPRQAELSLTNLEVTADLLSALPSDLAFIKEDFSPSGPISVRYQYQQPGKDRPATKKWTVQPLGMAGSFIDFPYPLTEVKGTILLDTAQAPLRNIRIDMSGRAGGKPASLVGTIRGPKQTSEVRLEIKGSDILLDDRILTALPPRAKKVVGQFLPAPSRQLGLSAHPFGHGDFRAWIHRDQGKTQLNKVFNITFRQCEVLYDQFPLPLKNVSGVLWLHPDHWEAKDFHGIHDGGEIRVNGRSYSLSRRATVPLPNGESSSDPERVHVRIQGKNIALDREFENALAPLHGKDRQELQSGWKRLRLAGRLNFEADVVDLPDQPQDIDVGVDVQGLTMQPTFFPYRLEQLRGSVRYSKGKLHLRDLSARHGDGTFNLPTGLIQISREGGFTAWLKGLTGKHIQPEKEFLEALPESLRRVVETIRLRNPLDLAASLTLAAAPGSNQPIQIWWEGAVALQNAAFRTGVEWKNVTGQLFSKGFHDGHRLKGLKAQVKLDRADILGQPLTNLFGRMEVDPETPDIVRLRDLKGDLFGGTLAGQAHLVTSPQLRYDVLLEALGIQLDLVGRHNLGQGDPKAQLQGPCRAAIHLHGEGDDLLNLKGNGRVDVPQGKMGELPVLLDLVKAFGLHVPDRTAFEQAHMVFAIEGPRIQVQQLDLYGNAVSLSGLGGLDLDGSNIQLNFTATPGRMTQLLPAGIGLIPQAISSSFLKIKMRGSLGKGTAPIRFDKELMPGVMEPLRRAMGGS